MASLRLSGVSVEFPIYHAGSRSMRRFALEAARSLRIRMDAGRATVRALDSIDLEAGVGERLAIVGPNGAGKSTLLRTMAGIYVPTAGTIVRTGRVTPLLSLGMGLNMEASGRDNILLLAMHLDIRPGAIRPLVDEIVEWTELGAFIDAPLRTYSAGMVMRLAFAVSTAVAPDILILDEWLAIGDVAFQRKAQDRMAEFVGATSLLVLASHAPDLLRLWCHRAVRLDAGRIVGEGPIDDVLAELERDGRTPVSAP